MAAQNNFFELLGDEETDASAVIERAAATEKPKKKQQQEEMQSSQHQDLPKLPTKPLPPAQAVRESNAPQPLGRRSKGGQGKEQGGSDDRQQGSIGNREQGGYRSREQGSYGNREQGGYRSREQGSYGNREQGGYGNREQGSYGNREQGGYVNRDRENNGNFSRPSYEEGIQRNRSFDRNDGNRREGNGFQSNRGRFYGQGRQGTFPAEDGEGGQNVEDGRGPGRFYSGNRWQGRAYGENADSQGAGGGAERKQQRAYVRKDAAAVQKPTVEKPEGEGDNVTVAEEEKENVLEKELVEEPKADTGAAEEKKQEEEEAKEMLLDDYYKALDEKTKHLKSLKSDERKVVPDKDLAKMVLVEKKQDEGDFLKLGAEKKEKKKEMLASKDDKPRKNVSINEFLKPAEGGEYYMSANRRGGRGGGRGRGSYEGYSGGRGRGAENEGYRGGYGGSSYNTNRQSSAPRIEDPSQFPTLGGGTK